MIRLEGVSKSFRCDGVTRHILHDVSFALPDRNIAILGRNGAGKSTLMRLIAGTLRPDRGRVLRAGRVSWPMGFSGSFHPALTGGQNVRFVGRVYGRDTGDLEEFVKGFADIGAYYHLPVSTYSSGMKARLAFAVSMGVDFDVYLVDEVIGVGDTAFRRKCQQAFRERTSRARVLMISHSPATLRQFCDSGLLLEGGRLSFFDSLDTAIAAHEANLAPTPEGATHA
ncbi:MAG TPA: ABC transporter ATP-binding protein [Thermohalobaculum sp.]|nr:ABC transporter ATP-binding protein [Thermohalobaculum sp.]